MDLKGKIAVALAVLTLIAWTIFNQKEMEKSAAQQRAIAAEKARSAAVATPAPAAEAAPGTVETVPAAAGTAEPTVPESPETIRSPRVEYTFSNLGGGITRALLLDHEAERGKKMAINEFGTVPIGAVTERVGDGIRVPFSVTKDDATGAITFERTDAQQLQLTKKFRVPRSGEPDEYVVAMELTFANRAAQPLNVPGYYVYTGAAAPVHQSDLATYTGLKFANGKFVDVNWFSAGGFLGFGHPERPIFNETHPGTAWLGVTNQYFSTVLSPITTAPDPTAKAKQRGASIWARRFDITEAEWKESARSTHGSQTARHAVTAALGMPGFVLEPGASFTQGFNVYTGPREYSRLKRLGDTEEQIMDFGIFGIVSRTLLNGMNWLNAKLGSYAAAIIVLTLIIKTALWPLQNKATNSMKRMQLLQPKMTELREKYADDPQRMNTEIMKLYRDFGVNPLSGCLPMLIQIPIFFGFYNMLGRAVELRNSKFLWVQDLSMPDTVAMVPLIGIPLNILPLVMAVTMFWQMAISPKSGDPMQQRIFMFMPLIFIFFCYNFASALALYWTVQNLFSVAQLYATRNRAAPVLTKKVAAPVKRK